MATTQSQPNTGQVLCAMCPNIGTFRCTGCGDIKYCSKQCQKNDWPIHKILCKTIKDFSEAQRPGSDYKRAIRFPLNSDQPHFFWLQFGSKPGATFNGSLSEGESTPVLRELLGATDTDYNGGTMDVFRSVVLNRQVENRFDLIGKFIEGDCQDIVPEGERNKSMAKIDQELSDAWYGEVVACGNQHLSGGSKRSYDLGPLEFRHAVDALRMRCDEAQFHRQSLVQDPSLLGVRCANAADLILGERQPIESLPVSVVQCTLQSDIETPVCDRIDILWWYVAYLFHSQAVTGKSVYPSSRMAQIPCYETSIRRSRSSVTAMVLAVL
ncbi:hypothetical protein IQ06DRAFT_347119 [Phaeosphaeriaceae sp. SRC1lsM3a]|nr:hypothetical protein IQ06DRAFT_347119 [Stagonospora sp. SRC1lsM3a]